MGHINRSLLTRFLQVILAACVLLGASHAAAADVRFLGTRAYQYDNGVAVLSANRVENFSRLGSWSGTLKMELWAFSTPFVGEYKVGYKTAQYTIGQLDGGYFFSPVNSGPIPFGYPPNGVWYFTLFLTEFDGGSVNDGYLTRDWFTFSTPESIGPIFTPPPPPPPPTAIEFYHSGLDHFFVTADPGEAYGIASGAAGPGWSATGQTFKVGGGTGVCRFYGSMIPGPNSHFYTADPGECQYLKNLQAVTPSYQKRWNYEGIAFGATRPVGGTCPAGYSPVFRAYNNGHARGVDSNHRLTRSVSAYQAQIAKGWTGEGVAMCVP